MYRLIVEVPETGNAEILQPSNNYTIASIEGLSPPLATISGVPLPISDGQVFSNARIDTRTIVLTIYINNPVETNRIKLYSIFPTKRLVRLNYANGTRNVMTEGYVETFETNLFAMRQVAQVTIKCLHPYFEDTTEKMETLDHTTKYTEFPFSIEDPPGAEMSTKKEYAGLRIENDGDIASGCTIEIHSHTSVPENSVVAIYNETSNERMQLVTDLSYGTRIIINTRPGQRIIRRTDLGYPGFQNWINHLDTSVSTWLTINPGVNVFSYEVNSGTTISHNPKTAEITFTYRTNYLGV